MFPRLLSALTKRLRQWLRVARSGTSRVGILTSRVYRGLRYAWSLLVWSRISAGRAGLLAIELPPELLARKGINHPPPHLDCAGHSDAATFSRGFTEVYALLFANLQRPNLLSPHRHAIPGPAFRGIYLWDSAFIAQIWTWWDSRVAQEVLLAVIDLRAGNRLQHVVSEFAQSPYTQPPLVAWSAARIVTALPDSHARGFIARVYRPLRQYHRWLTRYRRLANGLYFWAHPYESGVENAPRFGNARESQARDTTHVAAPDLNSYVVLQLEALAFMAGRLERHDEADYFARTADELKTRIDALLWHEDDGLYYDRTVSGDFIAEPTIASLLPLWAGVPDARCAARLRERIVAPRGFGTLIPLPSVSRDADAFEKDMWRGPVWINSAYAVIQGLVRYGYQHDASELAYRLCRGVYQVFQNERQIYEFYDPDAFHTRNLRRKHGNWWKALTLGTGPQRDFVGWSGLVNSLLLEQLLGLKIPAHGLIVCPRLPPRAAGMTLTLAVPRQRGLLTIQVGAAGHCQGIWTLHGRERAFTASFDQRVELT